LSEQTYRTLQGACFFNERCGCAIWSLNGVDKTDTEAQTGPAKDIWGNFSIAWSCWAI